ncbi:MAG: hypothetical protein IT167_13225 [Bryobacterales bacterium]|nr:hypothetical protein [Bryobacterales bacterium]
MKRRICATCVLLLVCLSPLSPLFARAFGMAASGMECCKSKRQCCCRKAAHRNAPSLVAAPSCGGNCAVHRLAVNAGKVLLAPPAVWRRPHARKENIRASYAGPQRLARYEVFFWKRPPPVSSLT